MSRQWARQRGRGWRMAGAAAALAAISLFPSAAVAAPRAIPLPPEIAARYPLPGPVAPPAVPSPQGLKVLKAVPDTGPPGTPFTLTGSGLPPNTDVDITWSTATKQYILDVVPDSVDFYGRQFNPVDVVIARGRTDPQGNLRLSLRMPQDYGALHDIYAVANGVQLAKGGVLVERTYSVSPLRGPVGTEITIKVNGLGWRAYMDTVAVLWDNKYVGFLSSVTTRGQAVATIRAAGPVGKHTLELVPASATTPYLNIKQSALSYLGFKRYTFTVTKDAGPPPPKVVWPQAVTPTETAKTTFTAVEGSGVTAALAPRSGPILTKTVVTASGLAPGSAELEWVSAAGTRTGAGWSLITRPLGRATVASDGTLRTTVTIPDDVGGWHTIRILQGGAVKAAVPFRLDQSLVGISPTRVKRGQIIRVHLKGVGFTELDNILAVTVDNAYIGYVCGFFSEGDVVLELVASGEPGTHLIDLYPTIYKQQKGGNDIWYGATPFLTYRTDFPLLALGYRLPAYRLAYTIVK